MKVIINTRRIVPNQDLAGKATCVSVISEAFYRNSRGERTATPSDSDGAGIRLDNKGGRNACGSFARDFSRPQLNEILSAYGVERVEYLVGKVACAVYTREGGTLTGLIPVGPTARVSFG